MYWIQELQSILLRYIRSELIIRFILTNYCWMYACSQRVGTLSWVKCKIAEFSSTKGITSHLIYVDSTRNLNVVCSCRLGAICSDNSCTSTIWTRCSSNTMLNKRIKNLTYLHWEELNHTIIFHFMNCSSEFYIHVQWLYWLQLVHRQLQGQKLPSHFAFR